jgi:hypothetical protein
MPSARPIHRSPDIEAFLTWVDAIDDFEIEVRREGHVYGVVYYRKEEPEGGSIFVMEFDAPRRPEAHAACLAEWADAIRGGADDDEFHLPKDYLGGETDHEAEDGE